MPARTLYAGNVYFCSPSLIGCYPRTALAHLFSTHIHHPQANMDSAAAFGGPLKDIVYENTYIVGPDGYGQHARLQRHKLQEILRSLLKERMEGQQYDPRQAAQTAKHIAEDLREKVKALGYERYKLVIQVTLGQKKGQAMRIVSRCLWDSSTDTFASEYYENDSLYCVCHVYGLYYE